MFRTIFVTNKLSPSNSKTKAVVGEVRKNKIAVAKHHDCVEQASLTASWKEEKRKRNGEK